MVTRLTLRLDEKRIEQAKRLARDRGMSVSRMFSEYIELLGRLEEMQEPELPPLTRHLKSIAAGSSPTETDHRSHQERKHR